MPAHAPRRLAALSALIPAAALTLAVAFAPVTASAQTGGQSDAQTGGQTDAETGAPDADLGAVVATVNGTEIALGEIILMRAALPAEYQSIPDEALYDALVDQAINQTLLAEAGRAAGHADTELARLRAHIEARAHLAEAGLRDIIDAVTSEEALRATYQTEIVDAPPVREVRASHILVPEREAAEALMAQLEDEADFAALAAEHGTDGTRDRGGDLGWFGPGQMVGEFEAAAFAAPVDEPVGPVESQFGYHLILVTAERDRPVPAFEEVRPELARAAAAAAAEASLAAAREGATIERPETPPPASAIRRVDLLDAN